MATEYLFPPEARPPVVRVARALMRPVERFLAIEAASGLILLAAAAVALIWANSAWADDYEALWRTPLGFTIGDYRVEASLHYVVNDILMAIFFFVVGLEIRREMHQGELSDLRRAALPIVAAIGGMVAPALLYLALAPGSAHDGWGVPMATDIAFAIGVLALLGRRVPPALRVLLLATAIIDDIGAIIVIALFYSSGVSGLGFAVAGIGIAAIVVMRALGVRRALAYIPAGAVIWIGVAKAGIHPTIAGVIIGLMTPAQAWYGVRRFVAESRTQLDEIEVVCADGHADAQALSKPLAELGRAHREATAPVERLEHILHPWVAYLIMPVFALANAGVALGGLDLGAAPGALAGVMVGLVVGKPLGILLLCGLAVRLGVARLPRGIDVRGLIVVGTVAGVGFTMALFIAGLAFPASPELHGVAKLGVLMASGCAAILAYILGRALLPAAPPIGAAATAHEAEVSTEA
ncbi:MAG: Na+/H+ antiporter NhaA [Myxococcales bacterium]|nr:Na+/H+ antiporter NhaA [Myxococcales bacterium]